MQSKAELDAGEDAAGAGFLPGVVDAVDDGEGGDDGDDPETGPMRLKTPPMMRRTMRSGRSMKPTLHKGMRDSARARA